jgi:hypothetical protein
MEQVPTFLGLRTISVNFEGHGVKIIFTWNNRHDKILHMALYCFFHLQNRYLSATRDQAAQ